MAFSAPHSSSRHFLGMSSASAAPHRPKLFIKNESRPAEPVQITFDIPADAAKRLSELAEAGDEALRELGIVALQLQGQKAFSISMVPTPSSSSSSLGVTSDSRSKSEPFFDPIKASLKRSAAVAAGRAPTTSGLSNNNLDHITPEKKRRKFPNSAALFNASGAISSLMSDGSSSKDDGPLHLRLGRHLAAVSNSASAMSAALAGGSSSDVNTQSSVLSRMVKTLMHSEVGLMPPPPPLSSADAAVAAAAAASLTGSDAAKRSRQIRLNPNTGMMESRMSGSETSSDGETEQELEFNRSIKSLELSLATGRKEMTKGGRGSKQQQSNDMALKLKLKLPSTTSRAPGGNKRSGESHPPAAAAAAADEPKIPKLILSMRDKTVKMAAADAASETTSASNCVNNTEDDGDDADDEEFDSIKLKNDELQPTMACDNNLPHLGKSSSTPDVSKLPLDSLKSYHSKESVWSKSLNCKDEINLILSESGAAVTSKNSDSLSVTSDNKFSSTKDFQSLVVDTKHFEANSTEESVAKGVEDLTPPSSSSTSSRVTFCPSEAFSLTSHRESDSHTHQGDDSGIESMDTLSEKSPNQGESSHDDHHQQQQHRDILKDLDHSTSYSNLRPSSPNHNIVQSIENIKNSLSDHSSLDGNESKNVTEVCKTETADLGNDESLKTSPGGKVSPQLKLEDRLSPALQPDEDQKPEKVQESSEESSTDATTKIELTCDVISTEPKSASCPEMTEDVMTRTPTLKEMPVPCDSNPSEPNSIETNNSSSSNFLAAESSISASANTEASSTTVISPSTTSPSNEPSPVIMNKIENASSNEVTVSNCNVNFGSSVITPAPQPSANSSAPERPTGITIQAASLRRSPAPPTTTSSLNGGYAASSAGLMRSALNVPAGAKMVPVKLVSVSGEGNVRLVRVSPVKTSIHPAKDAVSANSSVISPRTVVIKSSMLKTVGPKIAASGLPATASVTPTTSIVPSASANPTPLPAHLVNSQPLSPSLLNNVCKETSGPPTSVYNLLNNAAATESLKPVVVTASAGNITNAPAPVTNAVNLLSNLELLSPSQAAAAAAANNASGSSDKMEMFANVMSSELKEKLLSTTTPTLLSSPMLGQSLSITPVWGQLPSTTGPSPASSLTSSISVKEVLDSQSLMVVDSKMAVNREDAFVLRSLEPVTSTPLFNANKTELEVDTKSKGRVGNRPQKKSPVSLNSDFGGSLLRPLLQKEEMPVQTIVESKVGSKLKCDDVEITPLDFQGNGIAGTDGVSEVDQGMTTETLDNNLHLTTNKNSAIKKSSRNEAIKPAGAASSKSKAVTVSIVTSADEFNTKERRSGRQQPSPAASGDSVASAKTTGKATAGKNGPKTKTVIVNSVGSQDSTKNLISDWAAAATTTSATTPVTKSKRASSTSGAVNQQQQLLTCSTSGGSTTLASSCNVVLETNKNFNAKRIKTRSAKSSDDQHELKRRRVKLENL